MTFQVGMICPEGVVLASDRKHTNPIGFRHGRLSPKIDFHESENLAYCSAGDEFCNGFTKVVRESNRLARRDTSPVRLDGGSCGIVAISRDFEEHEAEFLCNPYCVAEGEGCEPSVRFSLGP